MCVSKWWHVFRFQEEERLQALLRAVEGIRPLQAGLLRLRVFEAGAGRETIIVTPFTNQS